MNFNCFKRNEKPKEEPKEEQEIRPFVRKIGEHLERGDFETSHADNHTFRYYIESIDCAFHITYSNLGWVIKNQTDIDLSQAERDFLLRITDEERKVRAQIAKAEKLKKQEEAIKLIEAA